MAKAKKTTTKRVPRKAPAKRGNFLLAQANAMRGKILMVLVVAVVAVTGILIVRHSLAASIDANTWAPTGSGTYFFDRTNLTGGTVADYQQRESQLGRKFDGHMFFMHSQVTAGDFSVPHWSLATDHVPFVMLSWGMNPPASVMADINSGKEDANIKFFADNVKSQLSPYGHVMIRPFYEFNIVGNPYNTGGPTAFISAWKHFVGIFQQEGVTNVKWVFDPNNVASSSTLNPVAYYPGAGYVDWIGIDTYPKNNFLTLQQLVTTGANGFDWYDTFKSYGKPLMVVETAIQAGSHYSGGHTRAEWWNDALAELKGPLSQIKALEYFDSNTNYNWLYDAPGTGSDASGIAAAKAVVTNCYLNVLSSGCGGQTPPPPTPTPTQSVMPPVTGSPSPTGTATPTPNQTEPPSPGVTTCPAVTLPVGAGTDTMVMNAPGAGSYRVWTRIMAPDATHNSLSMQVDQDYCDVTLGGTSGIAAGTWTWVASHVAGATSVSGLNLAAGPHSVTLTGQGGVKLDRVIFTTDTACTPTGTGANCTNSVTPSPSDSTLPSPTGTVVSSPSTSPGVTLPPTPVPSPVTVSKTVSVQGDSYVSRNEQGKNFGNANPLKATGYVWRSLLKFGTKGAIPAGATPKSVKLRLYVTDTSVKTGGLEVHPEGSGWTEHNVTWNNQPDWNGKVLAKSAAPKANEWVTINLPVSALNNSGQTNLGLRYSEVNPDMAFRSQESSGFDPRLIVTYQTGGSVGGGGGGGGSDTTPPSAPKNLQASSTNTSSVDLSWGAATDNVGVAKYVVMRSGLVVGQVDGSTTSYTDGTVLPGTSYSYTVRAYDAANNQGPASNAATVTTPKPSGGDTQAPTAPGNLTATLVGSSQVNMTWTASTDNVGVAGYYVYQNGNKIATVNANSTSFGEASLTAGVAYEFFVRAFDAAGNVSANSNSATVTTPGPTPTPTPPSPTPSPTPSGISSTTPCGAVAKAPATYQHVIWIWMENHTYSQVIGNSAAPYMTSLTQKCGTATKYASNGSPSLPNYIAATSGSNQGISDDQPPSTHTLTVDNLFRQVRSAGMTEKSYEESMASNCAQTTSGTYAVKHNPEAYYHGGTDLQSCQANNIPMGTSSGGNFLTALNNNSLPSFSFITPNLCNDTHDCSTPTGDAWLKNWVPKILDSASYKSGNTAVFIVYDEYTDMPTMFLAPSVKPGTVSATAFSHFSLLRTTEEMLGIGTHLGGASTANSLRSPFNM